MSAQVSTTFSASAEFVQNTLPVEVPNTTRSRFPGAAAIALIFPCGIAGPNAAQFVPPFRVRHNVRPPIYSFCESFGSIRNGVINKKFPAASVIPFVAGEKLTPFVDRRKLNRVVSK
jgi:hypothetical protein